MGDGCGWCISADPEVGSDRFQIAPHPCGGTGGTFTIVMTGALATYRYSRSTAMGGTFTTGGSQPTLTITGEPEFAKEEPSASICPAGTWLDAKYVAENESVALNIA